MLFAFTPDAVSPLAIEAHDAPPREWMRLFTEHAVGDKDGEAVIPASFKPCPEHCRNHGMSSRTDCGGGQLHRLSDNVKAMTALALDLDDVTPAAFDAAIEELRRRGLLFVWWHTHSYKPEVGTVRARLLVPFAEPLPLPSASYWSERAWPALVRSLGIGDHVKADSKCKDPARLYFTPRKPSEDAPHRAVMLDGSALDWRPILGALPARVADVTPVPVGEQEDPTRPVDLDDFRARLRRTRKFELVGLFRKVLAGEAPVRPPQFRAPGDLQREPAWQMITSYMALQAHAWESSEALLEVIRPAHEAEARESPEDHTGWDHVVDLFARAREQVPVWKAKSDAKRKADVDLFKRNVGKRYSEPHDAPDADAPANDEEPVEDPEAWRGELLVQTSAEGGEKLKSCGFNLSLILSQAAEWVGAFRFNTLKQTVEIHGGPTHVGRPRTLADEDVTEVSNWLEGSEYGISLNENLVHRQILAVARKNAYDPLTEYMNGVRWDGVARLDTMLERLFGARRVDSGGHDITAYVRAVSRKFAISLAARALKPGAKVDTVPVLSGLQGKLKSTAWRALVGNDFFSDGTVNFETKEAAMAACTYALIELGEMSALSRSEVNVQKEFISRQFDDYRPPYGRSMVRSLRRAVFVGTSNQSDYLKDPTGNRRYWPIACDGVDITAIERERDQLWAEAVAAFRAGEQWWLTDAEQEIANKVTEEFTETDPIAERMVAAILEEPVEKRRKEWLTSELQERLAETDKPERGLQTKIGNAAVRLGFKKVPVYLGGQRFFAYRVPEHLLAAPQRPRSRANIRPLPAPRTEARP